MVLMTIPLSITGVALAILLMPGANFSFMGILGFLALAGIVINNAIVLIDRIEIEKELPVVAMVKRLSKPACAACNLSS